jgi:hypothetical protein
LDAEGNLIVKKSPEDTLIFLPPGNYRSVFFDEFDKQFEARRLTVRPPNTQDESQR